MTGLPVKLFLISTRAHMNLFFSTEIEGDLCFLDETESRHCIRVLRMKPGSMIRFTDGTGRLYEGLVAGADPRKCTVKITSLIENFERREYRLHIGISPLKNHDRLEWFLEKCVEIGIDEITPVYCSNTEKHGIKKDRLNSIIISAMKQSIKTIRPVLNDLTDFKEFIRCGLHGKKMIAHCYNDRKRYKISDIYSSNEPATILIGPEGDFSEDEVGMAVTWGFIPVHLGNSRLRAETAGIAACHSVYLINQ